ncbi:MAG: Coq4 family protein [bacterium]|nr:Coq4 family protein [bacterium]
MSLLSYVRTLRGVIGMLRNPEGTESVFDIEDGLKDIEATKGIVERVSEDAEVAALMRERYLAQPVDVEALAKLPVGTLGHEFARHIREHGFDADYYRKLEVKNDLDWVLMRMRQTHDLWHVVTGIDSDRLGELAVKAFELAQTWRPLAAVITTGGLLRYVAKEPDRLGDVMAHISHGYQLGRHARPFLAQRWEEGWDVPLAVWRERVGLPAEIPAAGGFLPRRAVDAA